ncbi:MAG: DsbA family protein [Paracoccaceae bacterium]
MNRNSMLLVALIAVLGFGGFWYTNRNAESGLPLLAASAQDASDVDTSAILEMSIGNPDADVTVIEYASFTCPHCRNFHETVLEQLKTNYIDTGKINFIYREVYFDRFGLWAGMVARCGGEARYFGIANLIYAQQSEWLAGGDPAVIAENLRKIGKTAGLNNEQLDACLNDGEKAKAMVALYQQNAKADDVNSTPTFIINGEKFSNMNYDDFAAALDKKLGD